MELEQRINIFSWAINECISRVKVKQTNIEVIKQLIHDLGSVIEKNFFLMKSKDLHSMFNEMSHIANVTE